MAASKDESRTVAQRLGVDPFRKCSQSSSEKLTQLERLLAEELQTGYASDDASLVVFGSLARREWTSGSDLDWTYLIDGGANSDHLVIAQKIRAAFKKGKLPEPGATGTFGNLAFRHNIIHQNWWARRYQQKHNPENPSATRIACGWPENGGV
jgi:predicted nucleotidyltransferase